MKRRIAILIANESFGLDSGLDPLRGPRNDVCALADVLGSPLLGQYDDVITLVDKNSWEIAAVLEETLNQADRKDTLLIFYAGHGKLDQNGRLCLAAANTTSRLLYSTSVPGFQLSELVAQSRCESVILLLDCCYSGAIGKSFSRGDTASQMVSMVQSSGLHILTASTGTQTAAELEQEVGGLVMGRFTHAIVDGIASGSGDRNKDNLVSLSDLRIHLSDVIKGQTPQYWAKNASGDDPVISAVNISMTAAGKRQKRLGEWYKNGLINVIQYRDFIGASRGGCAPILAELVQSFLDDPDASPDALIDAWSGLASSHDGSDLLHKRSSQGEKLEINEKEQRIPRKISSLAVPIFAGAALMLLFVFLTKTILLESKEQVPKNTQEVSIDESRPSSVSSTNLPANTKLNDSKASQNSQASEHGRDSISNDVTLLNCSQVDSDRDGVNDCGDKCKDSQAGQAIDEHGCSMQINVYDLKGVNFDYDSSNLRPDAVAILNESVEILRRYPDLRVEVAGHTRLLGSEEYNQAFSERRAQVVFDFLTSHGVDRSQLLGPTGYGESRPFDSKNDSLNDRVELNVQ